MAKHEAKNLNSSTSESSSGEWGILHLNRFCPEEKEFCVHELLLEGLQETFDYLEKACKPKNEWRQKALYGEDKSKHSCAICLTVIDLEDNPIGIYRTDERRKKAFVLHDTCLSMISGNPAKVLPLMKEMLMDKTMKSYLEKNAIFECTSVCLECWRGKKEFKTSIDKKILSCMDPFCPTSFHFACALKSQKCIIDFYDKVLCCKEHEEVLSRPNDCDVRGKPLSQSPSTWDNCIECSQVVTRWPMRGEVFYMSCCESFCHWNCAFARLSRREYKCRCGNVDKFFETLQRQGLCLMKYRADMEKRSSESDGVDNPMREAFDSDNEEESSDDDDVMVIDDEVEVLTQEVKKEDVETVKGKNAAHDVEVIDLSDDEGKENGNAGRYEEDRKIKKARLE